MAAAGPAIREAATVMLLRDAREGPEVFLVRRNPASEFVGGFYVFPGGAVDEGDCAAEVTGRCVGRSGPDADRRLAVEGRGLGHWVAAIRELFEEAGVLLAVDSTGERVRLDEPRRRQRFASHRRAVDGSEMTMAALCAEEDLWLDAGSVAYAAHWITPEGQPRRYDTRFFVAVAPEGQEALHDDNELVEQCWVSPAEALERHESGDMAMILPTLANLRWLAEFSSAAGALASAEQRQEIPVVAPRQVGNRFVVGEGV